MMGKSMQGKIIKAIAGFYYVNSEDVIYQCKARGVFRNNKINPLIGDQVEFEITHQEDKEGNILKIYPRKNELIRPTVSNVDQAFVVFAVSEPEPNLNLLDRFLVVIDSKDIDIVICFNKIDLGSQAKTREYMEIYEKAGYQVLGTSAVEDFHLESVQKMMRGKTTVFAGPSGVGKSSIINILQENTYMETGSVSEKIKRGKHTTRHANLIPIDKDSYVVDTPGFSSLQIADMNKEEVKEHFIEFALYEPFCKFKGCSHINEPICGVKEALKEKRISQSRYDSYLHIYQEIENTRRY